MQHPIFRSIPRYSYGTLWNSWYSTDYFSVYSPICAIACEFTSMIFTFVRTVSTLTTIQALDRVLTRHEVHQLYLKRSKCQFCVAEFSCLGDFVGRNDVRMDLDKVKIIQEWPVPTTKKHIESFLGTTVYNSHFCSKYARFAGPFHDFIKGLKSNAILTLGPLPRLFRST